MLGGICNPAILIIRICNPIIVVCITNAHIQSSRIANPTKRVANPTKRGICEMMFLILFRVENMGYEKSGGRWPPLYL